MFRANKYVRTVIDADKMLEDFGNKFHVVSTREYKGKPESNLPAGTIFGLQIMHDQSPVKVNPKTGQEVENNLFEILEVTVPGYPYPNEIKKGDYVSLANFMPEVSYYIDFKPILRFAQITKLQRNSNGGSVGKN